MALKFLLCEVKNESDGEVVDIHLGKVHRIRSEGDDMIMTVPVDDVYAWNPPDRPLKKD